MADPVISEPVAHSSAHLPPGSLRVGLIGYGYAGKTFHAPLVQSVPGLELCAVASSRADDVRADLPEMTVYPDPAMLMAQPDIDLVVIASPNSTHAELARMALEGGKTVVVDKPFTVTLAEARDLVARAGAGHPLLSVFQNRRWDSDFLTVQKAIADGLIGRVTQFESHFDRFRPVVRPRWREKAGVGAGVWFDLGPHLVDQALLLFGLPDRIQASMAAQRTGAETDDWAHVILTYGERRIILQASMLVAGGRRRFVVHGDQGSLEKAEPDRQEAQLLEGLSPGGPGWGEDPDALVVHGGDGSIRRIAAQTGDQRAFYVGVWEAMRGSGSNPVPAIQALAVMAVVEAAALSAQSGEAVETGLTTAEYADWQEDRATRPDTGISPFW
jgi:predicted dehydrogenase